jgi:hypothetical protein
MVYGSLKHFGFSGHETFPFRYGWLKKGVDAVRTDSGIFSRDDAIVHLGVGKNMVNSISHWCLAAGLIEETESRGYRGKHYKLTQLGELVFGPDGYDPYMEDSATLWLIHWRIATNYERCTTWYYVFSNFNQPEFTKDDVVTALVRAMENSSPRPRKLSLGTLRRDVDCFVRTYVARNGQPGVSLEDSLECPLAELVLISQGSDQRSYRINEAYQRTLPDWVFAYALADYWESRFRGSRSLTVEQLAYQPGSLGRVFRLTQSSLITRLERIDVITSGRFAYSDSAGIRQVFRRGSEDDTTTNLLAILKEHYGRGVRP